MSPSRLTVFFALVLAASASSVAIAQSPPSPPRTARLGLEDSLRAALGRSP